MSLATLLLDHEEDSKMEVVHSSLRRQVISRSITAQHAEAVLPLEDSPPHTTRMVPPDEVFANEALFSGYLLVVLSDSFSGCLRSQNSDVVHCRSSAEDLSTNSGINGQIILREFLENSWRIPGEFLENSWRIPGEFLENSWRIPGEFLENSWRIPGEFLENSWRIPGEFLRQCSQYSWGIGQPMAG
ncbi:uncharacterized protein LY79DRAFT_580082 [Colletotrichum navitas]|uniref:Uncharacterized protein n=1 Tax=Colletotrichum navitas TaxID=681940 RepID=A0AAD8PYJ4_9PEZI|nr:uncharacterized protein LY79DRAFT_580082 [Colletotrichum navitas]KAK1590375.1 hypothetical protein LY79DRAFT_580082 [Colletotrichum navitas]